VNYSTISSRNTTATFPKIAIVKMTISISNDHFIDPSRPISTRNYNKGNAFRPAYASISDFSAIPAIAQFWLISTVCGCFSTLLIDIDSFDHFLASFNSICYKLIVSASEFAIGGSAAGSIVRGGLTFSFRGDLLRYRLARAIDGLRRTRTFAI
jgi:hypothetical protein